MIETLIVIGIVMLGTAWYMRARWRRRASELALQRMSGLELLEKRYARGEIDRDEYLQKKGDIVGAPVGP